MQLASGLESERTKEHKKEAPVKKIIIEDRINKSKYVKKIITRQK